MAENQWVPVSEGRGIWRYEYAFAKKSVANAFAVRLRDGELAVLSPPCRAPGATDALREHGDVVALVATNAFHHMGQRDWQAAFPKARSFAPASAIGRIAKQQPGLRPMEPLAALSGLLPSDMWIGEPAGMKRGDVCARIEVDSGTLWFFNDMIMNVESLDSFALPIRLLIKWTKSGPGFAAARMLAPIFLSDKKAYKSWLLSEFASHPPTGFITAHGAPILDRNVAGRLPDIVEKAF